MVPSKRVFKTALVVQFMKTAMHVACQGKAGRGAQAVNQENAPLLPIMLASKELPEMEEEEASLLEKHRQASFGVPVGSQYEHLSVRPRF